MKNEKTNDQAPDLIRGEAMKFLEIAGVKNLSHGETEMFLKLCQLHNLNPFKREIYISAYGDGPGRQLAIITGYEVYIKRAEASGRLDGWSVHVDGDVPNLVATVQIHRKDWSKPFVHQVEFREYVQTTKEGRPNKFWATKPVTMLKKVAISQGFRMAFPEILVGMPYTEDEMPAVEIIDIDHAEIRAKKAEKSNDLPELVPGSEQWTKAVEYVKNGGKIDAVRQKYNIRQLERFDAEVSGQG